MQYYINIFTDVSCEIRRHATLNDALDEINDFGDLNYVHTIQMTIAGSLHELDLAKEAIEHAELIEAEKFWDARDAEVYGEM